MMLINFFNTSHKMKKYFLLGTLLMASLAFAQYYPSQNYPDSGYTQTGWRDDWNDDEFYDYAYNHFPDEYFYEYPVDYYPQGYYESYYNDYRQSISTINWNNFVREFNLNPYQIQALLSLNRRFPSFQVWINYYGSNPNRWYYDRFYELERILGPRIYVVFQNRYFRGHSPVRYFQDYHKTYYAPRYTVVPRYRNSDRDHYRIDRDRYFQQKSQGNWNGGQLNTHDPGGFINSRNESSIFRENQGRRNINSPYGEKRTTTPFPDHSSGGFRNGTERTTFPNGGNALPARKGRDNSGGFRNGAPSEVPQLRTLEVSRTAGESRTDNRNIGRNAGFR